jgi:gamma-glutamylcyclotransferase (GGCT)/AIG2-like uncharacterized protein YtfP
MENLFAYGSLREKREAKTVLDGSKGVPENYQDMQ